MNPDIRTDQAAVFINEMRNFLSRRAGWSGNKIEVDAEAEIGSFLDELRGPRRNFHIGKHPGACQDAVVDRFNNAVGYAFGKTVIVALN